MSTNPNPSRITEEMWAFWLAFQALEPSVRLGGIYANKSGYHNTRQANQANWPGNYSVRLAADLQGPSDKAAAIDLTFPDAQAGRYETIMVYSDRLLRSGKDPHDERGNFLREFYGQADADQEVEGWDYQSDKPVTSDRKHLWHIHISVLRAHVANPKAFRALLSILKGETVEAWRAAEAGNPAPPPAAPPAPPPASGKTTPGSRTIKRGSRGSDVAFLQRWLGIDDDGVFGPVTEAAVRRYQRMRGLKVDGIVGPNTWRPILTGRN